MDEFMQVLTGYLPGTESQWFLEDGIDLKPPNLSMLDFNLIPEGTMKRLIFEWSKPPGASIVCSCVVTLKPVPLKLEARRVTTFSTSEATAQLPRTLPR